jgi:MFS family permease
VALTFFTVGIIICSVSKSSTVLITGRCIQGIGGGGIIVLTYVLMADLFTLQERSKFISLISITWLIGTACGPVLGGGFAYNASWVSIFQTSSMKLSLPAMDFLA